MKTKAQMMSPINVKFELEDMGNSLIDCQFMRISCEMDPPGGWIDRLIDINTGEVKEIDHADFVSGR